MPAQKSKKKSHFKVHLSLSKKRLHSELSPDIADNRRIGTSSANITETKRRSERKNERGHKRDRKRIKQTNY